MGLFDRLLGKTNGHKPTATKAATAAPAAPVPATSALGQAPEATAGAEAGANPVLPRLAEAKKLLDAKDLSGAVAIYEQVLAEAGDRADVLVTISGDLGTHGHVQEIVEWVAPRYDAERHGPATGLNVLQAYLALRNPEAAQHVLDILFALDRPELEERLHGFSNAIAELIEERRQRQRLGAGAGPNGAAPAEVARVEIVTISKPIWFYGLESLAEDVLPPKSERVRRIAFAQLGLIGVEQLGEAMAKPEDELGRLSRAIPLWFAEALYFCPHYAPVAALGVMKLPQDGGTQPALFGIEWTAEHIRQLVDTYKDPIDYVFTGALREQAGDYELVLRLWEVKKFRERKQFLVRWTPATADAELRTMLEQLLAFLEFAPYPAGTGLPYVRPAAPRAWLEVIGASFGWFLAEKKILPVARLRLAAEDGAAVDAQAGTGVTASLAAITLRQRLAALGQELPRGAEPSWANDPLVEKARNLR